jgi:hypothetical protein
VGIGAVNPDGTPNLRGAASAAASAASSVAEPAAAAESKIWTPGGEPAAAGEGQRIWLPE